MANAQTPTTCGSGAIYHWTDGVPSTVTGERGPSPAPIVINGTSADWEQYIVGAFNYAGTPKGGLETDPYLSPIAPANVQKDGLKDAVGANYDRDAVGQDHRDLRYFAFTYDKKNVYFFFRRPKNNTAQVTLYYFIDINVDGFMKTGEPVIKISFTNSGSSIEMGYYQAVNSNGTAAGSYDAVKGNIMSAPVARAKTNNTSQWEVGAADGWSMPGDFISLNSSVLPAVNTGAGEVFASATLTDTHPDGTVAGYGVEFAIPWNYIRLYNAQGPVPATSPLNYNNVFTWHVSLVGGNSGIDGAEDNAGGCCSGLAVSGTPNVSSSSAFGGIAPYVYRATFTYTELRNLNTKVTTGNIEIINPKDGGGQPLNPAAVQAWQITGTGDVDCNPATAGLSTTFSWVSTTTDLDGNVHFLFAPSSPLNATILLTASSSGCYYVDINTIFGGLPPIKTATGDYAFSTEFDISSNSCNNVSGGGSISTFSVLPVKLTYFNAARNGQNVNLTWQTSIEDNNKGFYVERMLSNGGWEQVTFVASKAPNGNSNSPLSYVLTDFNNSKGISQYRLRQADIDGKQVYSMIRSVRGEGQKSNTIIYPNPSGDGKVNIVFEGANSIRDVSLMDVSGKTLKQWKGVTNNNIHIDNLNAGFYTVRIVNTETGEQVVEKFIVNKR